MDMAEGNSADIWDQTAQAVPDKKEVLEFSAEAGRILLENGAEISRVEETMERICSHYQVHSEHLFILSNGIFLSGEIGNDTPYAHVQHVPVQCPQLEKVIAVNQLSREVEADQHSFPEAQARLAAIQAIRPPSVFRQILASGVGSACFCFLFGGSLADSACAFLAGFLLYLFMLKLAVRLSKIVGTIAGGILLTGVCILCSYAGLGDNLDRMIIGAIIPLIPGVPFTNGIRDIADGDYISGSVRLLDALLTFLCIAIGVGIALTGYHQIAGGLL